jgi:hypothetical protein
MRPIFINNELSNSVIINTYFSPPKKKIIMTKIIDIFIILVDNNYAYNVIH